MWGALMLVTTTLTIAAPSDYRFEPVEVQAFGPGTTMVVVRLVHIQDKKPVEGAVILESKTDMGPSGMGEMSGKVTGNPIRSARALSLFDRDWDARKLAANSDSEGARGGRSSHRQGHLRR